MSDRTSLQQHVAEDILAHSRLDLSGKWIIRGCKRTCLHMSKGVFKVKVKWHTAKCGDPYSEFVLCIYPSKVHTHSSEHTHTVNTHPEQWAAIYAAVPGEQLLKGTSVVVLRVERELYIHSPHTQFLPARDSNSQPLDYESDSLTIRPRLPRLMARLLAQLLGV